MNSTIQSAVFLIHSFSQSQPAKYNELYENFVKQNKNKLSGYHGKKEYLFYRYLIEIKNIDFIYFVKNDIQAI